MKNSAFSRYFSFAEVLVNLIPPSMQKCCALPNQPGLRYSLTRWARPAHPYKKKMIWRGAFSAGFFAEEWILTDQHHSIARGLITATAVLLCVFFGFLLAGQVTAFFGVFTTLPVLALGALFSAGALWVYFRWDDEAWLLAMRNKNADSQKPVWLNRSAYLAALAILALTMLVPLARWPYSPVSDVLHWDAGAYHFPKAIELFKTGTYWDLSIPYGEYPNGFESLLSISLLLTGHEALFGALHALIALFAFLVFWQLVWRYTRLPGGLAALVIAAIYISGKMATGGNPFWIFSNQIFMIGKNDLLMTTAVLAAALHGPYGPRENRARYHLPGMVFATAIVFMVKPTGIYAAALIWLPVLWRWVRPLFARPRGRLPWKQLLFSVAVFIPCLAWAGRDLYVIHTIFAPGDWEMNGWSIAANLTNPYFYNYLPSLFLFVIGSVVLLTGLGLWRNAPDRSEIYLLLAFLVSFALTPQTAFFGSTEQPTQIGWRMGMALLTMMIVLYAAAVEPWALKLLAWMDRHAAAQWAGVALAIALGGGLVFYNRGLLLYLPNNDIVLRDQYRESVGVDGYFSAYDYVRKNIHNAAVQIDGGLMYYVYGENFSNLPTKLHYPLGVDWMVPQRDPQYYVVFCTNFWTYEQSECPEYIDTASFDAQWQLLYNDGYGRVYQRR